MNTTRIKAILFAGLAFLGAMVQRAAADEWDQRTIFTFGGPVEIPGRVLRAGTYVFKLADSSSNRNIVQVFSKNEKHLYGTFLAIPDQRLHPAGKPIITFDERPAGSPEAVRAWFYPGEDFGHQFVYPKPKAVSLAKANNTPVPSMPAELAANTTKPAATLNEPHVVAVRLAPLKAQMPTEEELEIAEVFVADASAVGSALTACELPRTGSPLAADRSGRPFFPHSGPRSEICSKGVLKCQLLKTNLRRAAQAATATPSDLGPEAVKNISGALNVLLADVFALYLKTKNFHWHMSGPHFRDYHLLAR